MDIKKSFEHDLPAPERATKGAAGVDLRAASSCLLQPGERLLIHTGFAWEIPRGFVGMVCPRSGLALNHGITVLNAPGIVDSDYRGDVGVILVNLGNEPQRIEIGDRIAQMVVVPAHTGPVFLVEQLSDTTRGNNGFGSTGK